MSTWCSHVGSAIYSECPACDSCDATVLGDLGDRQHLRCTDCGIDYNIELSPESPHEIPDDYAED